MAKFFSGIIFFVLLVSCNSVYQRPIKFSREAERFIVLDLKLKDIKPGKFYFDTGSYYLIIDSIFYSNNSTQHKDVQQLQVRGVGNGSTSSLQIEDTVLFKIQNVPFTSSNNVVLDLKKLFGKKIDGIVGLNSFTKPFKIEYVKRKISFNKSFDGYDEIQVDTDGYSLLLPLEIRLNNGEMIKGNFLLDTGAGNTTLSSEHIETDGVLNNNDKTAFLYKAGLGGDSRAYSFFVKEVTLGKYTLNNINLKISTDTLGALANTKDYIGIIGNNLLNDFDLVIDVEGKRIWIKPNSQYNKNLSSIFVGFSAIDRTDINMGWTITGIYEDSDAYIKGLRYNDVITHVNKKPVEKLDIDNFYSKLKPDQELILSVKRSSQNYKYRVILNTFQRAKQ